MDELVVVRQAIDRQARVGGPLGPTALVDPDTGLAQLGQPGLEPQRVLRAIAVKDYFATLENAFGLHQPFHLGFVDAIEPGAGEGDRSRDVTPAGRAARAPAVVGGQGPNIDDGQVGVAEPLAKLRQGDGRTGSGLKRSLLGNWQSRVLSSSIARMSA